MTEVNAMKKQNRVMELLIKYRVFVIFLVLFAVMALISDSFLTRGDREAFPL